MSRQIIADVIQEGTGATAQIANQTAISLIDEIVRTLKKEGQFSLLGFGKLSVQRTKARMARNPATGEQIKVKAGKTIRFKASPVLKKSV